MLVLDTHTQNLSETGNLLSKFKIRIMMIILDDGLWLPVVA